MGWITASTGSVAGCTCDTRTVFGIALKVNASAIIIAHNHPSGNLKPSKADIKLTHQFNKAGKILELQLLDHLIITREGYYSFADQQILTKLD